jgi:hypothetical protein
MRRPLGITRRSRQLKALRGVVAGGRVIRERREYNVALMQGRAPAARREHIARRWRASRLS